MPPKKTEEMDEVKKALNIMSAEMSEMRKQQTLLFGLFDEIRQLKDTITEKDKTISDLERRVDDLEQYSRMDDLLISGLATKHKTYSRAVTSGGADDEPTLQEQESLENQVIKFFAAHDMTLEPNMISTCHTLPRKVGNNTPLIIMRFANRKAKMELQSQAKKLKGTDVYLNDHLTKRNAEIAKEARTLRKKEKIHATWTRSCKIWIKLTEEAKPILVRNLDELDKYKR